MNAAKDNGCQAVLRVTYVDSAANTVAAVALVVLPEGSLESGPRETGLLCGGLLFRENGRMWAIA